MNIFIYANKLWKNINCKFGNYREERFPNTTFAIDLKGFLSNLLKFFSQGKLNLI